MEYVQMTLNDWIEMKQRLRQELIGVKRSFVRIGYMLRKIEDQKGYEQDGYKSIAEFAQKELGLHPSTTTRFMEINREYSIDGYSERLREEYEDLSRSQLEEMLKLPEEDRRMIEPAASRESIRELKRFNASAKESGLDIGCDQLNGTGQQGIDTVIENFFKENQSLIVQMFQEIESGSDTKKLIEIVNPGGNRSYKKGLYFLMMYENKISIKKFGEKPQEMTWEEFFETARGIFGENWKDYVKTEEEAEEPEPVKEPIAPAQKNEGAPVNTEADEQLPGQMNVDDFPELLPEKKSGQKSLEETSNEPSRELDKREHVEEETSEAAEPHSEIGKMKESIGGVEHAMNPPEVIEKPFGSRKDWLNTLTEWGMAMELATIIRGMEKQQELTQAAFWESWLNEKVDEHGRVIGEE